MGRLISALSPGAAHVRPIRPGSHGAYQPAPAGTCFASGALLDGGYRIIAALVRGGTGEVYRADDLTLAHSVALKFLPAELARDPEQPARFHAEVRTTRQVSQVVSRNY
jgi:serine/threonine-protein kinase